MKIFEVSEQKREKEGGTEGCREGRGWERKLGGRERDRDKERHQRIREISESVRYQGNHENDLFWGKYCSQEY